jgi:hypothetical protein
MEPGPLSELTKYGEVSGEGAVYERGVDEGGKGR